MKFSHAEGYVYLFYFKPRQTISDNFQIASRDVWQIHTRILANPHEDFDKSTRGFRRRHETKSGDAAFRKIYPRALLKKI